MPRSPHSPRSPNSPRNARAAAPGSPRAPHPSRPGPAPVPPRGLADRLHSAAIHLLRRLRTVDTATGLTGPRASALSVLVFGGPRTLTGLAALEQVRPPTMSRLVRDMERDGLVDRTPDPADRRMHWIRATSTARRLLTQGRARRVQRLEQDLKTLAPGEYRALEKAVAVLERVAVPSTTRAG